MILTEDQIDHPGSNQIWVREVALGKSVSSTNLHDSSKSYWEGVVEVVECGDKKSFQPGQILKVRVGDGKPWFIRPHQYDYDYTSMLIYMDHVVAITRREAFD